MQIRAAHVDVGFGVAVFQHVNRYADVDQQPDDTDNEHSQRGDFGRIKQAFDGFVENQHGDDHQRQAVEHGGEDFKTFVAEGLLQRGFFFAEFERPQRHTQGKCVAEHMPRVGK